MARRKSDASDFAVTPAAESSLLITDSDVPTGTDLEKQERQTLAVILDDLIAYQDTLEMATTEDERKEIEARIIDKQQALISKVDRYAHVVKRIEFEAAWEKSEADRHTKRRKRYEAALQFLNDYAVATMQMANVRKLEGQGAALKLHQSPGQLLVTDESQVPPEYRSVSLSVPYDLWIKLCANLPEEILDKLDSVNPTISVSKEKAKRAIKEGEEVPGCDIVFPDHLRVE